MIRLLTGLPGAGKTLRAMWYISQALEAGRAVYVCGVDGINCQGVEVLDSPHDWQSLPDGSLVVVDEAQKRGRFPSRGGTAAIPESVSELSEHRHRGFDFILMTQHPSMIDAYVRRLVGEHEHMLRKFGLEASQVFTWSEIQDIESSTARDLAVETLWLYPKGLYEKYKSATLHTVKRKIPKKIFIFATAIILIPVLFGVACSRIGSVKDAPPAIALSEPVQAGRASVTEGERTGRQSRAPLSAAEWARQWQPRIEGIPWSAPAYDDRQITAYPQLYCVIQGSHIDGRCRCYTQQVTRVAAPDAVCRSAALRGVFDPYAQPHETETRVADAGKSVAPPPPLYVPVDRAPVNLSVTLAQPQEADKSATAPPLSKSYDPPAG